MAPPFTDTTGPGEGGSRCEDIGAFLHCGSTGKSDIWVGDMGSFPPHVADSGGVPPPGGKTAHGKTPPAPARWDLELPSVDRGHAGRRARGD